MNIGLLVIATNKYIDFLPLLYESMKKYFLVEHNVTMFVFTNKSIIEGPFRIEQEHYSWPGMTLRRYEIFCKNKDVLSKQDYLFYCDVDMIFEGMIGDEILSDLVGTKHAGFWNTPRYTFTYENNPKSKAYIAPNEGTIYYAGGFNGGKAEKFLKMSEVLYNNIQEDLKWNYIAKWHDESHLNRYFVDNVPSVILDCSYCFPKDAIWAKDNPFREIRKLCPLEKDHNYYRS
jgi:histo-blood group ABO system transferase